MEPKLTSEDKRLLSLLKTFCTRIEKAKIPCPFCVRNTKNQPTDAPTLVVYGQAEIFDPEPNKIVLICEKCELEFDVGLYDFSPEHEDTPDGH